MELAAVEKAQECVGRARRATDALSRGGLDEEQAQDEWWKFVTSANAVFSKLEQGAKSSSRSRSWYAKIKGIRRRDSLLAYIRQARHSELHSIEGSSDFEALRIAARSRGKRALANGTVVYTTGIPIEFEALAPGLKLRPVYCGRSGKVFFPPTTFRGDVLQDDSPEKCAQLVCDYLDGIIVEARSFV